VEPEKGSNGFGDIQVKLSIKMRYNREIKLNTTLLFLQADDKLIVVAGQRIQYNTTWALV
jgi:hypothetical protein